MQRLSSIAFTLSALLLFACDAPKGNLVEYTTATDGTDNNPPGDTDATDTGDVDTDSGGLPECVNVESEESYELKLDPPLFEGSFDGECVVSDGEDAHILTCGEQKVELRLVLGHQPSPLFQAGDTVQFSYRVRTPFYQVEWFSIRSAGDAALLLGGMAAEQMAPIDEPEFFAPLTLDPVEGVCAATIDCDNHEEPHAVAATHGADTTQIGAGLFGQVGDPAYDVSVIAARRFHADVSDGQGVFCSEFDVPEYFYRVLVRPLP